MPELPEVETVRRSLLRAIPGRRIESVQVRQHQLRRPVDRGFGRRLRGRAIRDVRRIGKYLVLELDHRAVLLVHLGMSGTLLVRQAGTPPDRHDHIVLRLSGGTELVLNDPRRFGLARVVRLERADELHNLGPDPLEEDLDHRRLAAMLQGRRAPIRNLLIDQRLLAGIGNIYANEILHRAGIRPQRPADSLRRSEISRLAAAIPAVLKDAVSLGGSSISDFHDAKGRPGYFQLHAAVYGREGEPCRRCGSSIRREVITGRSCFYCPRCQR